VRFLSILLTLGLLAAAPALAADYDVDPTHTRVGFTITHLAVSKVHGTFGKVSGKVSYDPKNIAATKIDARVGVTSVDTDEDKRDAHLRSPEFFDVAKFPEMTFVSTSVKNVQPNGAFDIVGDLTIHGVTKETTFKVTPFSAEVKDPWGNLKVGTSATAKINRKDFGLVWNKALEAGGLLVGEEVEILLDVELARAKGG
jgi:polyisoprenoid-binding protein YceI